jgi:hypothetical protein
LRPSDKQVLKNLTKPAHSEKVPSATNSQPQRNYSTVLKRSPPAVMGSPQVIIE